MNASAGRRLIDLAQVIRSKNAGPLHLTLDILFPNAAAFALAAQSPSLSATAIAGLYAVDPATVQVIPFAAANAIKVVMDRPVIAGAPGDTDVYGAQQHRPLLGVVL
jgi:hypothetical protein